MDVFDNQKETHPSYGMLGFYRQHGGTHNLFGSSIQCNDTICLRLKHGSVRRDLNTDYYFGGGDIVEVRMSYSQFATLIASMNVGDGIPVTITWLNGERIPNPPFVNKADQHLSEFRDHLKGAVQKSKELIGIVKKKFSDKKTFNKKDQEEILSLLNQISMDIDCNRDFQLFQFQEQMDKTVTEAKGEVEAFVQNKMLSIAQAKLVEDGQKALIEGDDIHTPILSISETEKSE